MTLLERFEASQRRQEFWNNVLAGAAYIAILAVVFAIVCLMS